MHQHNISALALAQFLEDSQKVKQVFYPGLDSSPSYAIAQEQMAGDPQGRRTARLGKARLLGDRRDRRGAVE